MKKLYTCYLSYPPKIDTLVRQAYGEATKEHSNLRDFDFIPMVPLWKIVAEENEEPLIVSSIKSLDLTASPLTFSGYEVKRESGYVFLVFNEESNRALEAISSEVRKAMSSATSSEDAMPYGFEPHTSLIKNDPRELDRIMESIKTEISGVAFSPCQLILSKKVGDNEFTKLVELDMPQA